MILIHTVVLASDPRRAEVAIHGDRFTLAKRRWRGTADDGTEFGFDLGAPLKDGDTVFQAADKRYVIRQHEEPVVEVDLDIAASAAAGIGWAIGNLHLELSAGPARMLAPDEPAVRQLLERLAVPYRRTTAIFKPGRFARGEQTSHELGPSHRH